jgi:hypothetical protein
MAHLFLISWALLEAVPCPVGQVWMGPWRLDASAGTVDGWEFAFDFPSAFSRSQNILLHNVRRRRWVRDHRAADPRD